MESAGPKAALEETLARVARGRLDLIEWYFDL